MSKSTLVTLILLATLTACSFTPQRIEKNTIPVDIVSDTTIDLLARENRCYEWKGKIWSYEELENHLRALSKNKKIETVRLRLSEIEIGPEHLVDIFQLANTVNAAAFYERYDGFKTIKWGQ